MLKTKFVASDIFDHHRGGLEEVHCATVLFFHLVNVEGLALKDGVYPLQRFQILFLGVVKIYLGAECRDDRAIGVRMHHCFEPNGQSYCGDKEIPDDLGVCVGGGLNDPTLEIRVEVQALKAEWPDFVPTIS